MQPFAVSAVQVRRTVAEKVWTGAGEEGRRGGGDPLGQNRNVSED